MRKISKFIEFTPEQKERAAAVDLEEFLLRQGEKLIKSGREKRLASDHSVTVRGCEWFDHASNEGGRAVSFIQKYYGKSYIEAMSMLLGESMEPVYPQAKKQEQVDQKPFAPPVPNANMHRVFAYLLKSRGLDADVVSYAAGLYGNTSDTNILQYSGRYRVLPLFTNRVQESDAPAHIWNNKLYVSDFNGKTDAYKQGKLNPLYPEVSTGDAFVETLLGGNERWLVMNSSFNDNTNQTAGIIPATAAFASSMNFTLTPHTYLVVEQDTDSLSIELNNFRTDKDELWVAGKSSNPDWTSYGTDWNGDNKLYVQEYMNYHIDNPKLDKRDTERYDLRDTVISLSVSNQPTLSIEFIGSGSTQHTYTESYVDGIYTLTITHNGRVKVTLT